MNAVLVTGASSFLGYDVVKRLNEQRLRPRVLELAISHLTPVMSRHSGEPVLSHSSAGPSSQPHVALMQRDSNS